MKTNRKPTTAQRHLLGILSGDLAKGEWSQIYPEERRTAEALERRGLIEITEIARMGEPSYLAARLKTNDTAASKAQEKPPVEFFEGADLVLAAQVGAAAIAVLSADQARTVLTSVHGRDVGFEEVLVIVRHARALLAAAGVLEKVEDTSVAVD